MTMQIDQETSDAIYDGLILRASVCEVCGHMNIVAYDDPDLASDIETRHDDHIPVRVSTGEHLAKWHMDQEDGNLATVSFEMTDGAIIRIGNEEKRPPDPPPPTDPRTTESPPPPA